MNGSNENEFICINSDGIKRDKGREKRKKKKEKKKEANE